MKAAINNLILLMSLYALCILSVGCSDENESGTYTYPVPTITGFTPRQGYPSSEVTITGTNFGQAKTELNGCVFFNDIEVTEYVSHSENQIVVKVPETALTGPVTVNFGHTISVRAEEPFTFHPGAKITGVIPSIANPGEVITITGENFFDIEISKINLQINGITAEIQSASTTEIKAVVPKNVTSGPLTITFEEYQTITGPEFTVANEISIQLNLSNYTEVFGTIDIENNSIGSTKDNAYVIYTFTVPADGIYDIYALAGSSVDGASLNIAIGTNIPSMLLEHTDESNTHAIPNFGNWTDRERLEYGPFLLQADREYYLKTTFFQKNDKWAGNLSGIGIKYASDQTVPAVDVPVKTDPQYILYQHDFNTGTFYTPFRDGWAYDPSYIKIENQYLEFYYNQAAYDNDPRRMRAGCEITCNYRTTTEGWYGFKIYLPEGKFRRDIGESIIAQLFNNGERNSWAGHVTIRNEELIIAHRHALIDPVVGVIGPLTWDKWIPVVVHFKVGRNNKGRIRAWMGNNMAENQPDYDSGGVNFGFGDWIDDETLNGEETETHKADYIGCKFGLYVSWGGDRTIRFDDVKALEGNPVNAFNIVKP